MITSHQWRVSLSCLVLSVLSQSAAATDQIVGVTSPEAGTCLVKRIQVQAGSLIQGVEFVNNDDQVIFPSVRLFRGPATRLSEATLLTEQTRVGSRGHHRVRVNFTPIPVQSPEEVLVVVRFPANTGVRGVGDGVGIGATQIVGRGDSYVAPSADEKFQGINLELGINLLLGDVSKATPGSAPSEQNAPTTSLRMLSPAAGNTTIAFGVERAMSVTLTVYDIGGRRVRTLVHQVLPAGVHSRSWDGRDEQGELVATGVYIAKLRTDEKVLTQKLVLMR